MEIPDRVPDSKELAKVVKGLDTLINFRRKHSASISPVTVFKKNYELIYAFCKKHRTDDEYIEPITRNGVVLRSGYY